MSNPISNCETKSIVQENDGKNLEKSFSKTLSFYSEEVAFSILAFLMKNFIHQSRENSIITPMNLSLPLPSLEMFTLLDR